MSKLTPYDSRRWPAMWDPFGELEDFGRNFWRDGFWPGKGINGFKTDITDTGDAFELEADLPGFRREDISVDVEGERLVINAKRELSGDEKDERGDVVRRERSFGSFTRSFDVSNVRTEDIRASFDNGVLKLIMPKKEDSGAETRHLEIK